MKLWNRAVIAAALVVFSVSGVDAEKKDALVSKVKERELERLQAMTNVDLKALDDLFAADVTYIHSNGIAQSKTDLIGMLTRGDIKYMSFDIKEATYRVYDQTVVGTGAQSISLTNSGRPFTSNSRYTVVYATVDGKPRVVAYQSTSLPDIVMQETPKGE